MFSISVTAQDLARLLSLSTKVAAQAWKFKIIHFTQLIN
jgi:hypothetical protein